VAYLVKLNIEMTMAKLITRLARGNRNTPEAHSSEQQSQSADLAYGLKSVQGRPTCRAEGPSAADKEDHGGSNSQNSFEGNMGIQKKSVFEITVSYDKGKRDDGSSLNTGDEDPLAENAGSPRIQQ
jgi:hypothetical protein